MQLQGPSTILGRNARHGRFERVHRLRPTTGFGGNGVGDCPFVNLTLHLNEHSNNASYCLSREFNQAAFQDGDQANVNACFATENYSRVWPYWSELPHGTDHMGVSGVIYDTVGSPGEPIFFLHHNYIDHLWKDLPARLYDMNSQNVPTPEKLELAHWDFPSDAILNYDGDPANVTTLHHNLWMVGFIPNATVADVMDLGGLLICLEDN